MKCTNCERETESGFGICEVCRASRYGLIPLPIKLLLVVAIVLLLWLVFLAGGNQ